MGDSTGARRKLRGEEGRRALRLQAPVRPEPPGGLYGRDATPADQGGARAAFDGSRQAGTPRLPLQAQRSREPVYVLRTAGGMANGDGSRTLTQDRLGPLHEAPP